MLKTLYFLCIVSLAFGQLVNLAGQGDRGVYLYDILIGVFALYGLLFLLKQKKLVIGKSYIYFLLFLLICVLSLVVSLFHYTVLELQTGIMYFLRYSCYIFAGLVVWNLVKMGLLTRKTIENSVIGLAIALTLFGFVQLVILPDFTVLDPVLGWDPHQNRLASTLFDPNFTGIILAIGFLLCLKRLFDGENGKKPGAGKVLIAILLAVGIFLTFSRSAWLATAVIVGIYGLVKSKTLLFLSLLLAFGAYFTVPRIQTRIAGATDPADSAQFRLVSWQNAWKISRDNLVTGVGFNNYKLVQQDYGFLTLDTVNTRSASGADSSLLFVLATTGIIGLIVYLVALFYPLVIYRHNTFYLSLLLCLILDSLFINSLFYPQVIFVYFSLLAVLENPKA
jgi:hypothetical protein